VGDIPRRRRNEPYAWQQHFLQKCKAKKWLEALKKPKDSY
jgi:hypothetical protein